MVTPLRPISFSLVGRIGVLAWIGEGAHLIVKFVLKHREGWPKEACEGGLEAPAGVQRGFEEVIGRELVLSK